VSNVSCRPHHQLTTYIDNNLLAAEGQVRTREMFCDLCSMHTAIMSDTCDANRRAVCRQTTLDRPRTQLLDIQVGAVMYPLHCTGIADKNFELVELEKIIKVGLDDDREVKT
jgi:hypothetical protein